LDSDGPIGPNTLPNSQSVILEWRTTGTNYHLYRGGVDSDGETCGRKKSEIWNELSALIKAKGIVGKRTTHQVGIKMCKMEGEYKKANDWLCSTGQGILEERGDIQDKIKKMCPYLYQIYPIMKDRPAVNPCGRVWHSRR
jgi:hypothetical protein